MPRVQFCHVSSVITASVLERMLYKHIALLTLIVISVRPGGVGVDHNCLLGSKIDVEVEI